MSAFLLSCKTHHNNQDIPLESSAPPTFFIANATCTVDGASIASDIKTATVTFMLYGQNLNTTLECMAWGAADLIFAPCILLTDPPTLTLTKSSLFNVEIGCVSLEDFVTDHITLFVTCTDKSTGFSTIKSLRSTDCLL